MEKFHSGFRTHYSTESALLRASNDLLLLPTPCSGLILQTITFESVISSMGVCVIDTALNWFPSYFSNRSFLLVFSCGVPQGLILASPPSFSRSALQAGAQSPLWQPGCPLDCLPQGVPRQPPASGRRATTSCRKTDRINLLPNAALRIANVTKRDSASYTCVARNQFGSASTTGRLLITEPTRITLRPTNMEIIVGESIVLPCQMACDPALDVSFSWAFNGQLIDFQRDGEHFERVGGVSGLK
ncbi:Contactin-3 [Merluccius polli]|uniref:Contactin-3 n=1 Tax=Merluccius polli TaxID=89951 RepID=A0AA47MBI4_MERPO|nr:Contactin-3 [Merluccius polli]